MNILASSRGSGRGILPSVSQLGRNNAPDEVGRNRRAAPLSGNNSNSDHPSGAQVSAADQFGDAVSDAESDINIARVSQYHHKQPESGDQGIKPQAEKEWPDMWHGDKNNKENKG